MSGYSAEQIQIASSNRIERRRRIRDKSYRVNNPITGTPAIRLVQQSPFRDYFFDPEAERSMRFYGVTHDQVIAILKNPTRTAHVAGETKLSEFTKPGKYKINVFHKPQLEEDERDRDNPRILDTEVVGVGVVEL